jgi:hypothetical protein
MPYNEDDVNHFLLGFALDIEYLTKHELTKTEFYAKYANEFSKNRTDKKP